MLITAGVLGMERREQSRMRDDDNEGNSRRTKRQQHFKSNSFHERHRTQAPLYYIQKVMMISARERKLLALRQ